MRRLLPVVLVSLSLAACAAEVAPQAPQLEQKTAFTGTTTTVDTAKSSITFVGKSSIVDHPGRFERFTATLTPDAATPADLSKASFKATIDLTSVKTDSEGLDGHMQKEDFFDTAKFPEATFVSTGITAEPEDGVNHYDITGDLTIKGVTKSITAEALITDEGLTATFELPRKEYGVAKDSYKDKLLAETVPVTVTLVFTR